jgi:hypothetical protein
MMTSAPNHTPGATDPLLNPLENRGVALSLEDRERLGLVSRLPSAVLSLGQQAERAYAQLHQQPDDLAQNVYLEQLHDRNEVLYYRLLADHLAELLSIVYDPTVGQAIKRYSHEFRRPRGVYLSIDRRKISARPSQSWVWEPTTSTCWWSPTPKRSSGSAAGSQGNFELNAMRPIIINNFLHSARILGDACTKLRQYCIEGTQLHLQQIDTYVKRSLMLVTALAPVIGYDKASAIAHKANDEGTTLRQAVVTSGYITAAKFDRIVKPEDMVGRPV